MSATRPCAAFSPDGDGVRRLAADPLDGRGRRSAALVLNVYRPDGTLVGTRTITATAAGAHVWSWDGKIGGTARRNGSYVLQLAGHRLGQGRTTPHPPVPTTATQVAAYGITVDTIDPVLTTATASTSLISPNGDGTRDSAIFALAATGATRWAVRVTDAAGTRRPLGDGHRSNGVVRVDRHAATRAPGCPTVATRLTLLAVDDAGNSARRAFPIVVDTTAPAVTQAASPGAFSPNRDGAADTTVLGWTASEKATGTARIYRGTTLIRSWTISGAGGVVGHVGRTHGHGHGGLGRPLHVPREREGRGGEPAVVNRTVIVDRTAGFLRWSRSFHPQDGDALLPTSRAQPRPHPHRHDHPPPVRLDRRARAQRSGRSGSRRPGRGAGRGTASSPTARTRRRAATRHA